MYIKARLKRRDDGLTEEGYLLAEQSDMPYRLTDKALATRFDRGAEYDHLCKFGQTLNFARYETVELKTEA